jgi:tetratricopeptide (TPR) repeat protein
MKKKFTLSSVVRLITVSLLFLFAGSAIAQQDLELAEYYYENGRFEEARLYYDKIYKTNKTNKVYTNYLNTLIALNDFEEAEKLVKKKIKTENEDGVAYVQMGDLYNKFNKKEEARGQFNKAVDACVPTRNNVLRLASEFTKINEYEYALKVYEKGKKDGKDGYSYSYEISNMQGSLGQYDLMIESMLDLLLESPNYMQTVQNTFDRTLQIQENEANMDLLKGKLLKRVQKYPENIEYAEMLTWIYLQKKEFGMAFIQASALDKRLNETGFRILNLGDLAANSKDYTAAAKAYQYIIDKGPANEYYFVARTEKLRVVSQQLAEKPGIDVAAYTALAADYQTTIDQLGKNVETATMIKDLAHIYAFYTNESDKAISLLREAIELPGVYGKVQAICKLELGDVLVFKGEIWDASLLYSQVELDFKEDPLGAEAKYRNARISYYVGDFEWAQGQLDALKASTTKLISNDAIDLSLLITDNFNMDTITAPMQMYARADLLFFQNKFDQSLLTLDSLFKEYPDHSLTDEMYMLKAGIFMKQGNHTEALALYDKVLQFHTTDITADDALFKSAEIQERVILDTAKAMQLYEKLITEYPGSLYVIEARKRFRALRGDSIE